MTNFPSSACGHSDYLCRKQLPSSCCRLRVLPASCQLYHSLLPPFRSLAHLVLLFSVGVLFAFLRVLFTFQKHSRSRSSSLSLSFLEQVGAEGYIWIFLLVGLAAAVVGVLCPLLDRQFGVVILKKEWSDIMKCLIGFSAINHGSVKIHFHNNAQLFVVLCVVSVLLWWLFDRSKSGFCLGILVALAASLCALILLRIQDSHWDEIASIQTWLPLLFFSGGVTFSNIGRQLVQSPNCNTNKHHNNTTPE